MSKVFVVILASLLLCACGPQTGSEQNDSLKLSSALGDAPLSNQFKLRVNGQEANVEKIGKFDIPVHYTHFSADSSKKLILEITVPEHIYSFSISPLSKGIKGKVRNSKLIVVLDRPEYLIIKINSLDYLFVAADTYTDYTAETSAFSYISIKDYNVDNTGKISGTTNIQKAIDDASENHCALFFPSGIYKTGQLNIKSNMCFILDDGALIKGSTDLLDYPGKSLIRMDSVINSRILGYGTIDGAGWDGLRGNGAKEFYLIFASNCENILVDGVILRDPTFWNTRVYRSKQFHMKNIKILNNRPYKNWTNTDGVDFDSSTDCSLIHSVMHCGDDNLVVKGLDSQRKFNTERIVFEDILVMSNSAATKVGTETCVEEFNDIVFKNIDIVKCKRGLVINGFDSALIKNVRFENINIESFDYNGNESPRLIDFEITDKSWRQCTGMCRMDSITINGLNARCSVSGVNSQIHGRSNQYNINNVLIQNLMINELPVKTLEGGNIEINDFSRNIIVN